MLAAGVGAYAAQVSPMLHQSGLLCALASLGCILLLRTSRGQGETQQRRGYLLGFGFFSGVSTAPLMAAVAFIDPNIPLEAFVATSVLFGCFTMAALRSRDRTFLYLGGNVGCDKSKCDNEMIGVIMR